MIFQFLTAQMDCIPRTLLERDLSLPELHPEAKTQAHISFYWMKIIKSSCYENYSEKLSDQDFLVRLTN